MHFTSKATGHCRGIPRELHGRRDRGGRLQPPASPTRLSPGSSTTEGLSQVGGGAPRQVAVAPSGRSGVCFQPSGPFVRPGQEGRPSSCCSSQRSSSPPQRPRPPAVSPSLVGTWACFSTLSPAHHTPGSGSTGGVRVPGGQGSKGSSPALCPLARPGCDEPGVLAQGKPQTPKNVFIGCCYL